MWTDARILPFQALSNINTQVCSKSLYNARVRSRLKGSRKGERDLIVSTCNLSYPICSTSFRHTHNRGECGHHGRKCSIEPVWIGIYREKERGRILFCLSLFLIHKGIFIIHRGLRPVCACSTVPCALLDSVSVSIGFSQIEPVVALAERNMMPVIHLLFKLLFSGTFESGSCTSHSS